MNITCNNCGMPGHLMQKCKLPIVSYGIIVYDKTRNKYLMICRSKSFGYIDFLYGNYSLHDIDQIKILVDEMSNEEKEKILNCDFTLLFNELNYKKTIDEKSKKKFNILKSGFVINNELITLQKIIENSSTSWETPEWEFPKGRKNYHEKIIECAIREFTEETGYESTDIKIIDNVLPFEEIFIGSNIKVYKHKYYLALLVGNEIPLNDFQRSEISAIEWKTFDECIESIRFYSIEKIEMLKNIHNLITNYEIII
jgi:8-oxo-dGTP pyrophosphatase MutT (NUDIX family)